MIKAGIIGSTGYAGQELIRLLLGHTEVEIKWVTSNTYLNKSYYRAYGNYFRIFEDVCIEDKLDDLVNEVDVVFLATPHGISASLVTDNILNKVKVIDLSADFRLKDKDVYKEWYQLDHKRSELLEEAVYGLCELNREKVKNARLIANPGCYPTCSILSIYPLLKENLIDASSLIIDAKSGVSGAGRVPKLDTHYNEVNESVKPYSVGAHRHTPEIEEQLTEASGEEVKLSFTPHLIPMNRGILITAYGQLKDKLSYEQVKNIYKKYYNEEVFVRLLDENVYPETKWVEGSNYVDINFKIDDRTNRIIVMGAMDNLVKGAAGQAVQNMNILFGLQENYGLMQIPLFP